MYFVPVMLLGFRVCSIDYICAAACFMLTTSEKLQNRTVCGPKFQSEQLNIRIYQSLKEFYIAFCNFFV
jgi:hypothetical protein